MAEEVRAVTEAQEEVQEAAQEAAREGAQEAAREEMPEGAQEAAQEAAREEMPEGEDKRVFTNAECPYYPCHELPAGETFNCVFCYCPLYALGPECGGAFRYTEKGYKDCSHCTVMHRGSRGFDRVKKLFPKLAELARREVQ